uniref:Mannan endo-1,4-beta-mannosidase n=1 Tax=Oryza meridionalis TaxID=40149 RepID=A0A0E0DR69_9ORYZ
MAAEQVAFMRKWMADHIRDSAAVLRKPLLVTEFGWSARSNGYTVAARDPTSARCTTRWRRRGRAARAPVASSGM